MKKRAGLLLAAIAVAVLALAGSAAALPSENPDVTPTIDGRVRAIEQVGSNIWVGGRFTEVKQRNGAVLGNVGNLAVFDSTGNDYREDFGPNLGGAGTEVWDIQKYGGTGPHANDILIAGTFGPSSTQRNLVLVDNTSGDVIRWYNSASLKSVLPAPNLAAPGGDGKVYAGGVSLSAFDLATGDRLWTRSKTSIVPGIRDKETAPSYRELVLDGQTIWAACACDKIEDEQVEPSKALVKLDLNGHHITSWLTNAGKGAIGQALVLRDGKLYLGAGGSDFVAQFGRNNDGVVGWKRDTSGSTQALEIQGDNLIVGGHFYEVGDDPGDNCGKGRPGDEDGQGNPVLDPNKECQRRQGIAAYTFAGALDTGWDPKYSGGYSLVWALHADGASLHTGGEFKTINGLQQQSYARFSP